MEQTYKRPAALQQRGSKYCPGCLHGILTRLIAECIDELEIRERSICVLPVGCSALGMHTFRTDMISAAHGRAPAVATGLKRCKPDGIVFTYQGDGDLAAIGLSEVMHAANRGENITVFFVNNSIYGMTGGQMAPTTLPGQKSTTTPDGRNTANEGFPMKMCEIISQLEAPVYVARFALHTPQNVNKARKGILHALECQVNGKGFSFVEVLTNCPTNWGMTPQKSLEWMAENTLLQFPLGEFIKKGGA